MRGIAGLIAASAALIGDAGLPAGSSAPVPKRGRGKRAPRKVVTRSYEGQRRTPRKERLRLMAEAGITRPTGRQWKKLRKARRVQGLAS